MDASGLHKCLVSFNTFGVRGSPILRTLLTALGLGLAAWPLWRMSRATDGSVDAVAPVVTPAADQAGNVVVPFEIRLSSTASRLVLRDENAEILWQTDGPASSEFLAQLPRLPRQIAVEISWSGAPAPRYFAKLRLDVPARESLTHVFDASGDIDDLWELP